MGIQDHKKQKSIWGFLYMNGFFSFDGPFFKIGNLLADLLILNLLWFTCSIPIFTIGASTTALYYVASKRVIDKEGYILRDFFKSFKMNFFQATIIWIILVIMGGIAFFGLKNLSVFGQFKIVALPLYIFIVIELLVTCLYVFPMLSKFHMKTIEIIKSAFILGNKHILSTIGIIFMGLVVAYLLYRWPFLIFLAMGSFAFSTSFLFIRIFKNYYKDDEDEKSRHRL